MDADAWNDRYRQSELVWSAGPNQFVVDHTGDLAPGRALDLACGEGRNALWLAEQGWEVVASDFSAVAVDKARRIAEHRDLHLDLVVADAVTGEGMGPDHTGFGLVVIAYLQLPDEALTTALIGAAERLAPGGRLLFVGHHVDNLDQGYGGPQDRAVLHDPAGVADHLAAAGLDVARSLAVDREVITDTGTRTAIDALVIATRPA